MYEKKILEEFNDYLFYDLKKTHKDIWSCQYVCFNI